MLSILTSFFFKSVIVKGTSYRWPQHCSFWGQKHNHHHHHYHHHHLSLNREGRWGNTDDLTANFLHYSLFSTTLWDLANSRSVHSLMLSSHLFFSLSCLLPPFTVPCKMVLARPDERETCPYHCCLLLFFYGGQEVFRLPAGSWHRLPHW